jgi:adenylylsulfate kinase
MESHLRSILKGVSWRVGGTTVTILVAWLLTHNLNLSAKIGFIETILKIGVFYVHERIWIRLNIGKKEPVEYQI